MKISTLLLYAGFVYVLGCSRQKQSVRDIDFSRYLHIEVRHLLDDIQENYSKALPVDEPTAYLCGYMFYYPQTKVELFIYTDSLQYQERYSEQLQWDVEKFKQEKIYAITVYGRAPFMHKKFALSKKR